MNETELDVQGLLCPMPVLKAKRALKELAVGDVLRILATDPAASRDMPVFCRQTGHELLSAQDHSGILVFRIRKTA